MHETNSIELECTILILIVPAKNFNAETILWNMGFLWKNAKIVICRGLSGVGVVVGGLSYIIATRLLLLHVHQMDYYRTC